jgi:hypothetical protein
MAARPASAALAARPVWAALAAATAIALLPGCGGGGDDAGLPINTVVDARAAWQSMITQPRSFTVAGRGSDGANYEVLLGFTPGAAGTFPVTGQAGATTVQAVTLKREGSIVSTGTATLYFNATTGVAYGIVANDGTCSRFTMTAPPPASTALNTGGRLYDSTELAGCTAGSPAEGSVRVDWTVENEGSVIFFCTNATLRDAGGTVVGTEQDCVQTDTAGAIGTRARVRIDVPGTFSLTARN